MIADIDAETSAFSVKRLMASLFALSLTAVCLALLSPLCAEDSNPDSNLSQSQREFREKYRLEEMGKRQIEGYAVPEMNQSTTRPDQSQSKPDRSTTDLKRSDPQSSTDLTLSDLKAVREINTTAFEKQELNVTRLKQDMNRSDRNAEAIHRFFQSSEGQKRVDKQIRFILKDEAFGVREYAGEHREIIDDRLNDLNNTVFSGQRANDNNRNRYLQSDEQVIVVISSSIPQSTLKSCFEDIDAVEAPFDVRFVLRGLVGNDPSSIKPTMEYILSIVSKEGVLSANQANPRSGDGSDKPFETIKEAVKKRMENNETATNLNGKSLEANSITREFDTYRVKIDINPKITRKYAIDRVPAVIYIRNYNQAIEEPKPLSEAINPDDNEEFFVAYGASRLDYSLARINEKAKSEGLRRLIEALQRRGFFGEKPKETSVNQTQTKESR